MFQSVTINLLCILLSMFSINSDKNMKEFAKDTYQLSSGKSISIEFYSHASICINYDGMRIYVDPIGEYADYSSMPKADIVLVTHEHYDHFDEQAIFDLTKESTELIANPNTVKLFNGGMALKNGESTERNGVKIKAFSAYNTTEGRDKFHPKNRDNGYLLMIEDFRIYISGDTEIVEQSEEIINCDILFLAVNQPYTMTIEQAKRYAKMISPEVFYPYHTTDTDMKQLEREFKQFDFTTIIHDMP